MVQETKTISHRLAEYAAGLRYEDIPPETVAQTKVAIADFLASAIAGWRVNGVFNRAALKLMNHMGGREESSVLFSRQKLPACNAAFLNAAFGHGADIDDGHKKAMGHVGITVIPPVLALAQSEGRSAKDAIAAIVAGYDVYIRVSNAVMPSHFQRGFHGTGTVGAIAAAAASARVLGLSREKAHNAISMAAVQASGLIEIAQSGQMLKPINPGNAARTGVFSALMARERAEGPIEPLTGEKGFFRAFADEIHPEEALKDLGTDYYIHTCYFKLYPACRHVHGMVDCGVKLYRDGVVPPVSEIDSIRLCIYSAALKVVGNIAKPRSEDEAKFSLTYAAATALAFGRFSLADLWGASSMDRRVSDLIDRMEIVSDDSLEDRAKGMRGSRLEIRRKDGTLLRESTPLPKGDPETPLSAEDMAAKLHACAEGLYDGDRQSKISQGVMAFEELADVGALLSLFE